MHRTNLLAARPLMAAIYLKLADFSKKKKMRLLYMLVWLNPKLEQPL